MKEGNQVTTYRGKGIIQSIEGNHALVWFGGHQRNAEYFELSELKGVQI